MTRQDYIEDWQHDVANGDTKLGLDAWIEHNADSYEEEEEQDLPLDTPSLDTSFHDHEMAVD